MSYTPTGMFRAPHKMRLMLAACATVQSLFDVSDATSALPRITTYGHDVDQFNVPVLSCPSAMVCDSEVHLSTDEFGGLLDIAQRTLETWIEFYVPASIGELATDQHGWVNDQFGSIVSECLALTGRGEPTPGSTHLSVVNPVYQGAEKRPADMRGDERLDPSPELPRWFGLVTWEIR
ncbi:MAG: hypothetical protein AAF539_13140 [Planctomycetota bacterium]